MPADILAIERREPKPKPDWGERLRDLGLLVPLGIAVWAGAGYPAVAGHRLETLRENVQAFAPPLVIWVLFVAMLWVLDWLSPSGGDGALAMPHRFTWWLLRNVLIVLGLVGAGVAAGAGTALVAGG